MLGNVSGRVSCESFSLRGLFAHWLLYMNVGSEYEETSLVEKSTSTS